jgi:uncharacterized protein YabN with tetrapyrrole methylase and pyrophosphatase domain
VGQLTLAAKAELERADEVLFVAADPLTGLWLQQLNPNARSLNALYRSGRRRRDIYGEMVEEILAAVRRGSRVCAAFYGHPGVFVNPSHEAVRRAREEGFRATMLPAVSAEDCLFADLGINPGERGWQSYEATELLLRRHQIDPTAALVLWQVDAVGKLTYDADPVTQGLHVLAEYLLEVYPADHEGIFYRASLYPIAQPLIERVGLGDLARREETPSATLYVPPLPPRSVDAETAQRLGLTRPR